MFIATLAACGSDGSNGSQGPQGPQGEAGTPADPAALDALTAEVTALAQAANPESCATCHTGTTPVADSGTGHQTEYDKFKVPSTLSATIDSVASDGVTSTVTFTIKRDGVGLTQAEYDAMTRKTLYAMPYTSADRTFGAPVTYGAAVMTATQGVFTASKATTLQPEDTDALIYAIFQGSGVKLNTEGSLYNDIINVGKTYGATAGYASTANVSACESCHGAPFRKGGGYRQAHMTDASAPDFSMCKACHYESAAGGHQDWQLLKDDPEAYAAYYAINTNVRNQMSVDEKAKYAYTRRLMNDVHMSHAMEFAYPQSMRNCKTCHDGKLDLVLTDANFKPETCISCHSVDGISEKMAAANYNHSSIIATPATLRATDCSAACHKAGGGAPLFADIHTGYDPKIYAADGTKYATAVTTTIDSVTKAGNILTINFHAASTIGSIDVSTITPTLLVGLYGYDTKDFLVGPHINAATGGRNLEWKVGAAANPRIALVSAAAGAWVMTADLTLWADQIAAGTIKRAEVAVMPDLKINGVTVGVNAPSKTVDLTVTPVAFDDFFGSKGNIVNAETKCNTCHDQLATSFHSGDRGGNVTVCRLCHESSSAGSHLEMQSRAIDSYVHAIHSFQAFDPGDIDFADPVASMEYQHHIGSGYPNWTLKNCESCHVAGTFDVPDQSKSLPALLSASDVSKNGSWDRSIGTVPSGVVGPATRACGGCHRAAIINEDDAGGLATFYGHTKTFGYFVENATGVWAAIVEKIQSAF
ncbi:MAG: hypothetical protein WAO76_12740 [Georgfuchsia sp.]